MANKWIDLPNHCIIEITDSLNPFTFNRLYVFYIDMELMKFFDNKEFRINPMHYLTNKEILFVVRYYRVRKITALTGYNNKLSLQYRRKN